MPTTIEIDEDTAARIDALAKQTGQDKAVILQMAIENGLEDIADYFRASEILERVQKGEEKVYSSEEVRAELGLDD